MATYTVSGDLGNIIGASLDAPAAYGGEKARAWLIPYSTAVVEGSEVRIGPVELTLTGTWTFSQANVPGGASVAYTVKVQYWDPAQSARATYSIGPFALTANTDVKDKVNATPWVPTDGGATAGAGVVSVETANSGTAYTVTAPTHGEKRVKLTLTGNATITLSGGTASEVCAVQLHLIQDATGSRTVTWPTNVDWGLNGPPVLSSTTGKTEQVYLTTDDGGASWQGALIGNGYTSPIAPSAPTGLGSSVVSGDVVLTWTQGAANGSTVVQNKIYRGTSSGGETLLTTITANTTYTDTTPLTDGTTYYYKVSAVNSIGEGSQSSEVSANPGLVVNTADNFNRANDTATSPSDGLIGDSTPTGARTWLNLLASGTWSVASNKAISNGANRKAGVDSTVANCTVSAQVANTGAAADHGIVFRWVDANNFCDVIVDPAGIYVQKTIGGSQTNVSGPAGGAIGSDVTVNLDVVLNGSSVIVKKDGTTVITTTIADAAVLTATKHGLMTGGNANVAFDNFQISVP